MRPHPYIGIQFLHNGERAEIVRVIGWYCERGPTGSHGTDRVDGVIVNLFLIDAERFVGHVSLPHAFCRHLLAKRERGQAA